ncbi:MAG: AMP-binding protein, partial [Bacteroidota bacterium]
RLFDIVYYQSEKFRESAALYTKYGDEWIKTSAEEHIKKANEVSRGLLRLGIEKNDKIAVISSNNRTDWHVLDTGILQTGAQNVPVYPTISEEDYKYVLNHSESKYCFVSDVEILAKVNAVKAHVPTLREVYTFDEVAGAKNWKEVIALGEDDSNQHIVEARKKEVKPEDLATIIYTSGTTGNPKGVMLSHKNIVANILASAERIPISHGATALSFLPVCHIFERMIVYLFQYYGISVYFSESMEKITDNLKEVKPDIMTVVPRLMEKIYDKICAKGSELKGVKKKLFFWAVKIGLAYEPYGKNGWWYAQKLKIARKLIFSKWNQALGGNLKIMVSGSAALQPRLNRIFAAAGTPVMEGYGLTETAPVISVNDQRNGSWKIGTVGKVISGVEVKIAEDGEILCKGPNIMLGYYKDPQKTSGVIKDGYFHTGDIGELDEEGFLRITDRKKEMFKTSGGKYIAPQIVENEMKQSRLIEQIMVIGEGEKMPAALIQPNFEFIMDWARRNKINIGKSNEEVITHPDIIERIHEEIIFYNERFGKWEKIKKFELTPDVWTIEGGHLTPTLKLKRQVIKGKYKNLYEKIYEHPL